MTLRYCLENLRWNQKNSGAKPRQLPFRESKVCITMIKPTPQSCFLNRILLPRLSIRSVLSLQII
jgi:hypothetical protein